jgi:ABC-2 type transport system permease protein
MEIKSSEIKNTKKINVRKQNMTGLFASILIIIAINMIGSRYFTRIDLTAEKRFTLTEATRDLLRELDDIVYFRVYLEGEFPAGFKRLRNQTREMLDELRAYSGNIQYEFINPTIKGDWERTEENYSMLVRKGLQPTQLQVQAEDASSQQIIFPGAIVSYRGREIPVSLLQEQRGMSSENVLNHSAQMLEYNLAFAIHTLTMPEQPVVAFLEGHGELEFRHVADITYELDDFYEVERLAVNGDPAALNGVNTLVVAKPLEEFPEDDKFVIDQFIMNGGNVLWLIDPVFASMDSLQQATETIGMAWPLNLDDMLFRYGARLNTDLITDLQALPLPITTGFVGNRPQISMIPWFYFPLVRPATDHPVVKNLNALRTEFVSSVDTVGAPGIEKTFLLESSSYTRVLNTPARISFDIMQSRPDERQYQDGSRPVAVLLEGEFESVFRNRLVPAGVSLPENIQRKDRGLFTRMIIVADGDIIRNQFDSQGAPLPLGYDRYLDETFGNRDFILNAINYLNDDTGIIEARTREVRLRLLDTNRLTSSKLQLQVMNVILPLVFIILFAISRFVWRKRKYSKRMV